MPSATQASRNAAAASSVMLGCRHIRALDAKNWTASAPIARAPGTTEGSPPCVRMCAPTITPCRLVPPGSHATCRRVNGEHGESRDEDRDGLALLDRCTWVRELSDHSGPGGS